MKSAVSEHNQRDDSGLEIKDILREGHWSASWLTISKVNNNVENLDNSFKASLEE